MSKLSINLRHELLTSNMRVTQQFPELATTPLTFSHLKTPTKNKPTRMEKAGLCLLTSEIVGYAYRERKRVGATSLTLSCNQIKSTSGGRKTDLEID